MALPKPKIHCTMPHGNLNKEKAENFIHSVRQNYALGLLLRNQEELEANGFNIENLRKGILSDDRSTSILNIDIVRNLTGANKVLI